MTHCLNQPISTHTRLKLSVLPWSIVRKTLQHSILCRSRKFIFNTTPLTVGNTAACIPHVGFQQCKFHNCWGLSQFKIRDQPKDINDGSLASVPFFIVTWEIKIFSSSVAMLGVALTLFSITILRSTVIISLIAKKTSERPANWKLSTDEQLKVYHLNPIIQYNLPQTPTIHECLSTDTDDGGEKFDALQWIIILKCAVSYHLNLLIQHNNPQNAAIQEIISDICQYW